MILDAPDLTCLAMMLLWYVQRGEGDSPEVVR